MRISHEWLAELVDLAGLDPAQLARALTLSGTEVERVMSFGGGLDDVVVGEVVELERMAGSDHLWITRTRVPGEEPAQVVCGAQNLHLGALVPWARPGARLPGGREIGRRPIRGVDSDGMLCAADELQLGLDHEGILLLPEGEARPGRPLSELYPADTVYELEVLSNRGDCLCHLGVARELAAVLERPLLRPEPARLLPFGTSLRSSAERVTIEVQSEGDCPLYLAQCLTITDQARTPAWMARRLLAAGSRSISPVVDVANYVMLEQGQPAHTFDLEKLGARNARIRIGVRRARAGEQLLCLDAIERSLDQQVLVITADDRPVALAGIIGGLETAVGPGTKSILLEVANFDGVTIRRASRRLGLRTDASARFERRLSANLVEPASERFADLLAQVGGGQRQGEPAAAGSLPAPTPIRSSAAQISRVLGAAVAPEATSSALQRLGFTVELDRDGLVATAPWYRIDVTDPIDLTEEVGRLLGYAALPDQQLPCFAEPPSGSSLPAAERLAAEVCLGAGFSEAVTLPLVAEGRAKLALGLGASEPLRLSNPLSRQLGWLRRSLLPGLVDACVLNQSRGLERVRLFEQGRAFWQTQSAADRPQEPELIALVDHSVIPDAGPAAQRLDQLLQLVSELARRVGSCDLEFRPLPVAGLHPRRSAQVWAGEVLRGVAGELEPGLAARLELRGRAVVAELRVDGWFVPGGRPPRAAHLSKMPALTLDLAVVVPERAERGPALRRVERLGLEELESISLIDEYRGQALGAESKGWTFRLVFREAGRTLTGQEGEELRSRVLAALAESAGARLRSEESQ